MRKTWVFDINFILAAYRCADDEESAVSSARGSGGTVCSSCRSIVRIRTLSSKGLTIDPRGIVSMAVLGITTCVHQIRWSTSLVPKPPQTQRNTGGGEGGPGTKCKARGQLHCTDLISVLVYTEQGIGLWYSCIHLTTSQVCAHTRSEKTDLWQEPINTHDLQVYYWDGNRAQDRESWVGFAVDTIDTYMWLYIYGFYWGTIMIVSCLHSSNKLAQVYCRASSLDVVYKMSTCI